MDVIPSAVHGEVVDAMEAAVADIFEAGGPPQGRDRVVDALEAAAETAAAAPAADAAAAADDAADDAHADDADGVGGDAAGGGGRVPRAERRRCPPPPIAVRDAAAWAIVSARTGAGVAALRGRLGAAMPPGPFLYPADDLTDMPLRLLAAEVTREAAFLQLRRELPYDISVATDGWAERPDGSARVEQVVYVARASQVGIVTGDGGGRIKAIGSAARAEMGRLWGRPVHLFLKVKVRGGWKDERREFARWGLDYNA